MPFAGAFALENLQKYAEMLRQRKLAAEKVSFDRAKTENDMRLAQERLTGDTEDRRLRREFQESQLRSLDESRKATEADRQRDDAYKGLGLLSAGTRISPEEHQGFLRKGIPGSAFESKTERGPYEDATLGPEGLSRSVIRTTESEAARAKRVDDERMTARDKATQTYQTEQARIAAEREERLAKAGAGGQGGGNPYFSMQAIYDPQGRPIGAVRMDHRTGVATPVDIGALAGGQMKPPPGDLGKTSILNEASLDALDRLKAMYDTGAKDTIGPAMGRLRTAGQKVPGVSSNETFSNFSAATSSFRNAVIKAITGAQMSEPEANRIRQQIPEVTDKPVDWQAKYEQTKKNLADIENRIKTNRPDGSGGFRVVGERTK